MAYAFRYLATDPDLQARIASDERLIPRFVEEGLSSYGIVSSPMIVTKDFSQFSLARTELRTLAEEWLKQIPSFRLKSGTRTRSREGMVIALEWDVQG